MATVKCISPTGCALPSGRRLILGQDAEGIDLDVPAIARAVKSGRLLVTSDAPLPTDSVLHGMTVGELKDLAEQREVDLAGASKKDDIIAVLEAAPVPDTTPKEA